MRASSACRLIGAYCRRNGSSSCEIAYFASATFARDLTAHANVAPAMAAGSTSAHGGAPATSPAGWASWLLAAGAAAAAAAPISAAADAPGSQGASFPASGPSGPSGPGGDAPPPLTNHPLEYDPVTNEHTARMTMARTAALEFYNAGKYAQAETKFREAVAEAELGFEADDPHIASAKNNLAEFLRNTGRWDEAEKLYKEALDLLERNYGEKHWLFVSALHNLALSYESRGQLDAALATMERVLALRLAMFGPRHFLYADSMFAMGHMVRAVAGRQAEAVRMMEEAVRLLEEAEKVQVNVVLQMLTDIAACHTADRRPAAAATALRRAIAHLATERGDDAATASALSEQLAEALTAAGRPAEAAEVATGMLAARRRLFGEGALVVATSELRAAQLQLLAAQASESASAPAPSTDAAAGSASGPGPALRALQHADSAFRIAAATVEETAKRGLMSGPQPDKLPKRLRAAHAMGSAAKLMATLAGVAEPTPAAPPPAAEPAAAAADAAPSSAAASPAAPASSSKRSWWPFGKGKKEQEEEKGAEGRDGASSSSAAVAAPTPLRPPAVPVADLALADRRLEMAAAALTEATRAGQELLQAVGSGRRALPKGLSADELVSLLVESQLQLLDVLERLGLVLQARVAAGQGEPAGRAGAEGGRGGGGVSDVVARHRAVLEQQERVAAELLG